MRAGTRIPKETRFPGAAMSDRHILQAFMAKLIEKAGGFDAAAAIISARLGHEISKGSISKRQHLQLDWPFVEIMALEDALGDPCVSLWRARRLPQVEDGLCLLRGAAKLARESGEAFEAVADLAAGSGCRDKARKEVADLIDAGMTMAAILDRDQERQA